MEDTNLYVVSGEFGLHNKHRFLLIVRATSFEEAEWLVVERQKEDFQISHILMLNDTKYSAILHREYLEKV